MVVVPIGKHEPFVKPAIGAEVNNTEGVVQLSVAVGAVQEAMTQPFKVVVKLIFAGQFVKVGGVTSLSHGFVFTTVTVKLQVAIFPLASVALDRKSTRLNSSHVVTSRMPSSA